MGAGSGETQQDAMGDDKEDWESTVSDAAKLLLRTVRDSTDVFPPLKSIAGGLCSILENCEVWFTSYVLFKPRCSQLSQRAQGNRRTIESLAPRLKSLAESLCAPVSEGDRKERLRRITLKE